MSRIRCAGIAAASLTALCILSPIAASAKPVNGELAALAKQGSTLQQARFYGGYGYVRPYSGAPTATTATMAIRATTATGTITGTTDTGAIIRLLRTRNDCAEFVYPCPPVCAENSDSATLVMKSAKNRS
jgi:hypothetical protein